MPHLENELIDRTLQVQVVSIYCKYEYPIERRKRTYLNEAYMRTGNWLTQ